MNRSSKLVSLSEAAAGIHDAARIALGGFAIYQRPMAMVREIVRQNIRDLTIVGVVNAIEADMLIGAGCVRRIETSYVGLEKFGLAPNFRRAAQAGEIEVVDYPELIAWDRFRADQEGLPFWPCTFLGGSDIARNNPDIVKFFCPLTGRTMWAVPPAKPDVVVIHAAIGDEYGNVAFPRRRLLPQGVDVTHTRSCDTVIVTVERIVSTAELQRHPELVEVPAFRTTHIVEAPFGAHPTSLLGFCNSDDRHFETYAEAGRSQEAFAGYLDQFVRAPRGEADYLDAIGLSRLLSLRTMEMPA